MTLRIFLIILFCATPSAANAFFSAGTSDDVHGGASTSRTPHFTHHVPSRRLVHFQAMLLHDAHPTPAPLPQLVMLADENTNEEEEFGDAIPFAPPAEPGTDVPTRTPTLTELISGPTMTPLSVTIQKIWDMLGSYSPSPLTTFSEHSTPPSTITEMLGGPSMPPLSVIIPGILDMPSSHSPLPVTRLSEDPAPPLKPAHVVRVVDQINGLLDNSQLTETMKRRALQLLRTLDPSKPAQPQSIRAAESEEPSQSAFSRIHSSVTSSHMIGNPDYEGNTSMLPSRSICGHLGGTWRPLAEQIGIAMGTLVPADVTTKEDLLKVVAQCEADLSEKRAFQEQEKARLHAVEQEIKRLKKQ